MADIESHINRSYENIMSLLNRNDISSSEIEEIVKSRYISQYKVQKAIMFNPATPLTISMRYINYLRYKDLEGLIISPYISHILKKKAESLLVTRYDSLTLGEKVELSKRTRNRALFSLLLNEDNDRIWNNTLRNPNLFEKELVIYTRTKLKDPLLAEFIMETARWGSNYSIKRSLAYNRNTPLHLIYEIGYDLLISDISSILEEDTVKNEVKAILWNIFKQKIGNLDEEKQLLLCDSSNKWIINALIDHNKIELNKKLLNNSNLSTNHLMVMKNNLGKLKDDIEGKEEILDCIEKKLTKK